MDKPKVLDRVRDRFASNIATYAPSAPRTGCAVFLSLLDAERTQLEAESGVAEAEAQTYTALIAVYKTFGGGWET